jgi:hypothetical protein
MIIDIEQLSIDIGVARTGHFDTWKFGYLGEINASHNTDYPLLMLLPPSSRFTDVYTNDETLTLVFHMYDVKPATFTDSNTDLEKTFDSLLEKFKATIQALVIDSEHKYILTGGWTIDRVSREFNDDLIGLVITIELNKYSFCLAENSGQVTD